MIEKAPYQSLFKQRDIYILLPPELRHLEKLEEEQFTESDLAAIKTFLHLPVNSILKLGDSLPWNVLEERSIVQEER